MFDNIENSIKDNLSADINIWSIIFTSGAILLAAIFLYYLSYFLLKRIIRKTKQEKLEKIRKQLRLPSILFFLVLAFMLISGLFVPKGETASIVNQILTLIIITSITWIIIKGIQVLRVLVLDHYDTGKENNLKARKVATQFKVLERVLIFVIILIAIAIALMTFEGIKRIGISIFASAGIAGIILGLAAQKLISTILAGFQIAITQPIRIDDVVIVEDEWGWIEEITLTYVVVRIWDKRRLILPSTYFMEKPFQNWTRSNAEILGTVYMYTDYTIPVEEVRKELKKQLEENEHWDGAVGKLQVTDAKKDTLELRALMSAKDSPTAWDLRVSMRETLISFLQKNYPQCLPKTRVELNALQ